MGALALVTAGCSSSDTSESTSDTSEVTKSSDVADEQALPEDSEPAPDDEPTPEPVDDRTQEETCDWDSPKISGSTDAPSGQKGELSEVLVGSWQHTHTDEGSGFEAVTNDHRYVFPSPDRMLYCQHVPSVTEHAENAGNVVLNGTAIELPGGNYAYTVTAWDDDTMVWDNPVGGGFVYLLQRR